MTRRKLIGIAIFALIFMIIGRNLSILPRFSDFSNLEETKLKEEVKGVSTKQKGIYSVYYVNLKNKKEFGINEKQTFTGASVNKVPIVASLYYLAKKGEIDLDDRVTILEKDVQDYGTGSIRYAKPGDTYSLRNLAKLSLQQSDNTAAHILGLKIGMDRVQKTINSWGLSQTNMNDNKTSNYDMYLLFQKIYNGEVTDTANTKELLEFLTDSDFEDRLPKNLPEGSLIYHKTGDEVGFVHDVGIIKTSENVYYLGVLTSDVGNNEENAKKAIAEISKKVFEFVEN